MTYVHWQTERGSWHSLLTFTRAGSVLTRCGRLIPGGPDHRLSDSLPLDERSCEVCLRLALHDGEAVGDVPGDSVPQLP